VATGDSTEASGGEPLNEVRVRGRWVGAQERQLPSGDELVVARVVVPRPAGGVDTLDCAVWAPALRRRAMGLADDALVEVSGSLRRRFWRTPGGPASRYEVEVNAIRRVRASGSRVK
jgi:single-strand DNA-binding protein